MRTLFSLALGALILGAAWAQDPYASVAPKVKKELYAKVDLRGKPLGGLPDATWITHAPGATKGKFLLVDLWATWCPPCRELMPELDAWSKKYKDRLVVVGISDEKPETVREYLKKAPVGYAIGTDAKNALGAKMGVRGIPHVVLVSPDGVVRWQGFPQDPADPLDEAKLKKILAVAKS